VLDALRSIPGREYDGPNEVSKAATKYRRMSRLRPGGSVTPMRRWRPGAVDADPELIVLTVLAVLLYPPSVAAGNLDVPRGGAQKG
jgi:hypothetical protein